MDDELKDLVGEWKEIEVTEMDIMFESRRVNLLALKRNLFGAWVGICIGLLGSTALIGAAFLSGAIRPEETAALWIVGGGTAVLGVAATALGVWLYRRTGSPYVDPELPTAPAELIRTTTVGDEVKLRHHRRNGWILAGLGVVSAAVLTWAPHLWPFSYDDPRLIALFWLCVGGVWAGTFRYLEQRVKRNRALLDALEREKE